MHPVIQSFRWHLPEICPEVESAYEFLADPSLRPLGLRLVTELLESGVRPGRVLLLAAHRGLDFSMNAEVVRLLVEAGAPRGFVQSLIDAPARGPVQPVASCPHLSEGGTRPGRGR